MIQPTSRLYCSHLHFIPRALYRRHVRQPYAPTPIRSRTRAPSLLPDGSCLPNWQKSPSLNTNTNRQTNKHKHAFALGPGRHGTPYDREAKPKPNHTCHFLESATRRNPRADPPIAEASPFSSKRTGGTALLSSCVRFHFLQLGQHPDVTQACLDLFPFRATARLTPLDEARLNSTYMRASLSSSPLSCVACCP